MRRKLASKGKGLWAVESGFQGAEREVKEEDSQWGEGFSLELSRPSESYAPCRCQRFCLCRLFDGLSGPRAVCAFRLEAHRPERHGLGMAWARPGHSQHSPESRVSERDSAGWQ